MRGVYGYTTRGSARVGISLFHTVGDRDRAIEQINTEMHQIASELYTAMGVDWRALVNRPPVSSAVVWAAYAKVLAEAEQKMRASKHWPIWRDVFNPVYEEWNRFYADQSSWNEFFTSWDEYEHWQDRIKALYSAIESQGLALRAPAPQDLPRTIWAQAEKKVEDIFGGVTTMLKVAVYGGLAVAGVFVLAKLGSDLRDRRDPAQTYLQAYQSRRPLMLPAPR